MATITARVPLIEWQKGFERHWNGDNPVVTHAFNALSFILPMFERLFIDVVLEVVKGLDFSYQPELKSGVKDFISQESIHSNQHHQYNAVLQQQGFDNVVHSYIVTLHEYLQRHFSPLTKLAVVSGYEHYTAILGNYILSNPQVLKPAQPDMALVWGWHSAEEMEHKAVCFDLYQAAGGGWLRRVFVFLPVTLNFSFIFSRLYLSLLYRDGCLKPSRLFKTIAGVVKLFFGGNGVGWHFIGYGPRYLSPRFHPSRQDNRDKLHAWLTANHVYLRIVGE